MITTRQLRYLDAIARCRHFGRAAAACNVTQPALSMQLQQLEADLGVLLIERRKGEASLTAAGVELADRAGRILTALRDMADAAHRYEKPLSSQMRLGLIPTIGPYLLPRLLPELRRRFPDLALSIRESRTAVLVEELLAGTLDVMLAALPVSHPDLSGLPVMEDEFVLALPPDHRAPPMSSAAAADLIDNDRLLLLEEGHCLRDQALDVCNVRQAAQVNQFGASSLSTIVQMVANGMGMTLLPEVSLPVETSGNSIVLVRFAPPAPRRTLGFVYRRNSSRHEDCIALRDAIVSCQPMAAPGRAG